MAIRQPIVVTIGHVDSGKTFFLDCVRGTAVQKKEAGGITQCIGASIIPLSIIKEICGDILKEIKLTIPGLLFIDTPGHEAFTNLRKRGGSIADLAVLVIDIMHGIQAQTIESIQILKEFKVPFVILLNKIDLIKSWVPKKTNSFLESFEKQGQNAREMIDNKIYDLIGKLSLYEFDSERFDRIEDYTKKIAIIPCSAKTGEGISEILMVLGGLAQRYLEKQLKIEVKGPAKGSVLEVKEVKGLGVTIDAVIYDGEAKEGDIMVIAGLEEPIVTRIKALLQPAPLKEIRETGQFKRVKKVTAACGVKIACLGLEDVIPGMPFEIADEENLEYIKEKVQKQVKEVMIEVKEEIEGVILKTDTLGSLEALIGLLKKENIPIKKATIGSITKIDIIEAESISKKDPFFGVVLGFNVKVLPDAEELSKKKDIDIILSNIIYKIIENYQEWKQEKIIKEKEKRLAELTIPSKIRVLPGFVFRQSNPAIVGVEVLSGKIKTNNKILKKDGNSLGKIREIQDKGKTIPEAEVGSQVAVSITKGVVGRNLSEGDELLTDLNSEEFRELKSKFLSSLSQESKQVMKDVAELKRKKNPVWGL